MALLFCDSFDDRRLDTNAMQRYDAQSGNISTAAGTGADSRTGAAMRMGRTAGDMWIAKRFSGRDNYIVGFAYYQNWSSGAKQMTILGIYDRGNSQVYLRHNEDGTFTLFNGAALALETTTADRKVPTNELCYIEVKVTIHPSAGSYQVRVNGTAWLLGSGVNTDPQGTAQATEIRLEGSGSNTNCYPTVDDFYICDNTGGVNDDFLGMPKIVCLAPTGAGAHTDFTPVGSATNWGAVDEKRDGFTANPDDDTSYVSSSSEGARDSYGLEDMPAAATDVLGVHRMIRMRRDELDAKSAKPGFRVAGVDYSSTAIALGQSYVTYSETFDEVPGTAVAWTPSDVNALELAVEVGT